MTKVDLKGINTTWKTLADGTRKAYEYHRATGARLNEHGERGSPEYLAAWIEAERIAPKDTNNVAALIRRYLLSRKFEFRRDGKPKAESTKREYRRMLSALEAEFGSMPLRALESAKVNAVFIDYHESIAADRPREADNRMTVFSAVLSEAKRRGQITRNPIEGFERAHFGDRSEMIWTEADIKKFMGGAPVELQRALILAIHTGQRYGDLIRLRWSDYDGATIRLKQSKTQAKVPIACTATLRQMLDKTPRKGPYILTRADDRPWFTEGNDKEMGKAWRRHMQAAGFYPRPFEELSKEEKAEYLHFNDLRGTAVTLLSVAGCSIPQICSITGHTLQSATSILERYLARTPDLSRAAILAFENAPATAFANRLQTATPSAMAAKQKTKGKQ